jgi:hypothetical protein
MTTACDDSKGHGEEAQCDDDGRHGAIMTVHGAMTTMTAYNNNNDAQWHAAQRRTARTMTSGPHQANRQHPPLPAQYRRSP